MLSCTQHPLPHRYLAVVEVYSATARVGFAELSLTMVLGQWVSWMAELLRWPQIELHKERNDIGRSCRDAFSMSGPPTLSNTNMMWPSLSRRVTESVLLNTFALPRHLRTHHVTCCWISQVSIVKIKPKGSLCVRFKSVFAKQINCTVQALFLLVCL